jgi:hypothetical protein
VFRISVLDGGLERSAYAGNSWVVTRSLSGGWRRGEGGSCFVGTLLMGGEEGVVRGVMDVFWEEGRRGYKGKLGESGSELAVRFGDFRVEEVV